MKRFELTLIHKDGSFQPISVHKIESDDIISLLTQFNVALALVMREEIKKELDRIDDDIPF